MAGAGAEITDKGGAERSRSRNNVQRWSRKEPEAKVNNFGSAKLFYFRYFSILLKHSGTPIIVTEEEKKLQRKATFFEGGSSSQESSASVPQHRLMNKRFHNIAWRCDKFSIARFAANISRTRAFQVLTCTVPNFQRFGQSGSTPLRRWRCWRMWAPTPWSSTRHTSASGQLLSGTHSSGPTSGRDSPNNSKLIFLFLWTELQVL